MTASASRPLLGCIADDFTGATDLANMLVKSGMRTVQTIGVPAGDAAVDTPIDADAIVVALKSRTIPAADAVAQSLAAYEWLRAQGCRQFFFKYCSTFDSTDAGNIGPVADALLDAAGGGFSIACPAFPENGRTIYRGHLFVGDVLLNESGMENHPLTPMKDANLVRVLQRQTKSPVGLIRHDTIALGAAAVRTRIDQLRAEGARFAIADALSDRDLYVLGEACAGLPLVTGGCAAISSS
ncbi:3-oxo-tetronate kinase, partial [Burkholderia stabilis]